MVSKQPKGKTENDVIVGTSPVLMQCSVPAPGGSHENPGKWRPQGEVGYAREVDLRS